MRVKEQPREAVGEVLDEAVGDVAQRLLGLRRQLSVVVLLRVRAEGPGSAVTASPGAGPHRAPERTLFLMARSRSRTDVPL